jgi:hypothetical protein
MIGELILGAILCSVSIQGGQGGQGGGSMGNFAGAADQPVSKQHILTPGDVAEWPFSVKEGETLLVQAESTNFDPALEVVTDKGKKVAENDDIRPGEQAARLVHFFEKPGNFKVLVKNYRSNAGGQYTFTVRRFTSTNVPVDTAHRFTNGKDANFVRFEAKAGQFYLMDSWFGSVDEVFDGTGERVSLNGQLNGGFGIRVFEARSDGHHYVRSRGRGVASGAQYDFAPVLVSKKPLKKDDSVQGQMRAYSADLYEVAAKDKEFLSARVSADRLAPVLTATHGDGEGELEYLAEPKYPNSATFLVRKDQTFQIWVVNASPQPLAYSLNLAHGWSEMSAQGEKSESLPIGHERFYGVDLKAGDVIIAKTHSDVFDARLSLLNDSGNRIIESDDVAWNNSDPAITYAIPQTGRYYFKVDSTGGGGGAYTFNLSHVPSQQLAVNEAKQGGGSDQAIYSISAEAGKPIFVRLGLAGQVSASLFDPEGKEATLQQVRLSDREWMYVITPAKSGVHRLWLRGEPLRAAYTIRAVDGAN